MSRNTDWPREGKPRSNPTTGWRVSFLSVVGVKPHYSRVSFLSVVGVKLA